MLKKLNPRLIGPLLLIVAQYSTQIIGPLVSLLVVRYLGAEQFGIYASALAITTLLSVLPDFGLQQAALNMNARKQWRLPDILRKSFKMGILYASLTYVLVVIWLEAIDYSMMTRILGLILGLTFFRIAIITILTTAMQIQGRFGRIAIWNMCLGVVQWVSTLLAMLLGASIYWLILGPILLSLIVVGLMAIVEWKSIWTVFDSDSTTSFPVPTRQMLDGSWKFGMATSMHQLYYKSDAAVLSVFRQPIEVGQYSVAFRLIELFFLFPGVVFNQVLYPKYCVWVRNDLDRLRSYYNIMNKVMILSGVVAAIALGLFGRDLLQLLFGETSGHSFEYLIILALAIPLRFWVSSAGAVLTNDRLIVSKLKIQTAIAVLNVVLNVLFIPKYGANAAAINMIVTHLGLLAAYSLTAHRNLFGFQKLQLSDWLYPLLIFILAVGVELWFIQNHGMFLKLLLGTVFLALILVISFFWVKQSEKTELLQLLRRKDRGMERASAST